MIKTIKLETAAARAFPIAAGVVCLLGTFFFIKWCFANTIATRAPVKEVAELAISMAPSDPQTHYAFAVLNEKSFLLGDLPKSLAEFERATALSPNDFRLWVALGRSRERNGDAAGAELALRRAIELAPHYAQVRWTLGNILLRGGKIEEAFSEISRAAESDATYRIPALTTAWQIFGGNLTDIKQFTGGSAKLNSALVMLLVERKRFDEAFEIWNALSLKDRKTTYQAESERLLNELIAAKKYHKALAVQQVIGDEAVAEKFALGKIYNGGFETDITRERVSVFDWQIADAVQPQIGLNVEQKHGGNRSIFMIFNSSDGRDFRTITQMIAVEPSKKYIFDGFYKSNLKTAATLYWQIVDAADAKVLAATKPISDKADWTDLKMEFVTSENTEAVLLQLAREQCKSIICPISGNVWFDDFSISQ